MSCTPLSPEAASAREQHFCCHPWAESHGIKENGFLSEYPQFLKISYLKDGGGGKNVQMLHGKPFGTDLQLLKLMYVHFIFDRSERTIQSQKRLCACRLDAALPIVLTFDFMIWIFFWQGPVSVSLFYWKISLKESLVMALETMCECFALCNALTFGIPMAFSPLSPINAK